MVEIDERQRLRPRAAPWSPRKLRGQKRALPVALGLWGLLGVGPVQAAELSQLLYHPALGADCPDEGQLVDAIAARLGYDPFRAEAPRRLEVTIEAQAAGYGARIELADAQGASLGRRELLPLPRCAELLEPLALAIALALDPLQLGPPAPIQPTPSPSPEVVELPTEDLGRFYLSLAPLLAVAALPTVGPGGRVELGMESERWGLGLEGRFLAPSSQAVEGGEITAFIMAAALSGCAQFGAAGACLVGTFGALRASSDRLLDERKASSAYATLGLRGRYLIEVAPPLSLGLTADVAATLTRIELVDSRTGAEFWATPVVQGILGVEARLSFPR